MKITKLALLANKIHEIYYVFINSYKLKIKKTGTQTPVYFLRISSCSCPLFSVHGDQEFFIGFSLAQAADQEFHRFDGCHIRQVIPEYPKLV
jgi:hypothetical protein